MIFVGSGRAYICVVFMGGYSLICFSLWFLVQSGGPVKGLFFRGPVFQKHSLNDFRYFLFIDLNSQSIDNFAKVGI
jgi:hypothetical protein